MRLSSFPLPEWRHVPGLKRDTAGVQAPVDWSALDDAETWAYGIDLFNARYYWEAHEAWEKLWRGAAPSSPDFAALKGLIQIAAALLKVQIQNEPAARRLARRALGLLGTAAAQRGVLRGLSLESVVREARARLVDAPGPLRIEQAAFVLALNAE